MEPENGPLKEAIPIGNPPFSGSMLIFGGVTNFVSKKGGFWPKALDFLGVQKKAQWKNLGTFHELRYQSIGVYLLRLPQLGRKSDPNKPPAGRPHLES